MPQGYLPEIGVLPSREPTQSRRPASGPPHPMGQAAGAMALIREPLGLGRPQGEDAGWGLQGPLTTGHFPGFLGLCPRPPPVPSESLLAAGLGPIRPASPGKRQAGGMLASPSSPQLITHALSPVPVQWLKGPRQQRVGSKCHYSSDTIGMSSRLPGTPAKLHLLSAWHTGRRPHTAAGPETQRPSR